MLKIKKMLNALSQSKLTTREKYCLEILLHKICVTISGIPAL